MSILHNIPEWLKLLAAILALATAIIKFRHKIKEIAFPTKFLKNDHKFLCDIYKAEATIADSIPYREEFTWFVSNANHPKNTVNSVSVQKCPSFFHLNTDRVALRDFYAEAHRAFEDSGRIQISKKDVIRLTKIDRPMHMVQVATKCSMY